MRPLVPAGALLLLCAATPALATPASAATAAVVSQKAAGSAESALGLLSVTAAGRTVDVATIELISDRLSATPVAKVVVTPIAVDGTPYGQQTITSGSATVPALPGASIPSVPGVLSVGSPAVNAAASSTDSGSTSSAGAQSLGSLSVLGLTVDLSGAAEAVTDVTGTASTATKRVQVTDLALPSIAELLAGLGLDVDLLPLDTLLTLVDELGLVLTSAVSTAIEALDAAQAELTAVTATLTSALAQLSAATDVVDTAVAALTTAIGSTGLTEASIAALPAEARALLPAPVLAAFNDLVAARSAADAAQAVVNTAQAVVDAAQTAVQTAVAVVIDAVEALLDGTPLLSLDSFEVSTEALATSAKAGGQQASVTGGEIVGLNVLGTDVLDTVLGTSSVELLEVTDEVLDEVDAVVDGLTGTLASVLSDVAGLELTAPQIDVLGAATRTGVVDGFGEAETLVSALTVTLPRITLPTSLSLPGVGALPAFEGVTAVNGALSSLAGSVDLVTLTELSRFRPAVTSAPPTGTPTTGPTLPTTGGAPGALVGLGLLTAAGAVLVVRRRTAVPAAV